MAPFFIHLLTLGALIASAIAIPSSNTLSKRDSGLKCETQEACVSWYTTGDSCRAGFQPSYYDAPGAPVGKYCERECTDSEKTTCAEQQCTFNSDQCLLYPGNPICGKAMSLCDQAFPMPKRLCTRSNLEVAVQYNDATGQCELAPDAPEEKLAKFNLGDSDIGIRQYIECEPVTAAGAESVFNALVNAKVLTLGCSQVPDQSNYELRWKCDASPSRYEDAVAAARAACKTAATPPGKTAKFWAGRG